MPRLASRLFREARAIDRYLPALLRPCRELRAAQNELRWLREHVARIASSRDKGAKDLFLKRLIQQRAKGKPLQYILGTEFFGDLELYCRPGVLIPRQETAASVTHLAQLLSRANCVPSELRVLDLLHWLRLQSPLLLQHELLASSHTQLQLLGIDISPTAIELAKQNTRHVRSQDRHQARWHIDFLQANLLNDRTAPPGVMDALRRHRKPTSWDILISNPPYISPDAFWKTTTRSVRTFEPKIALVPPPSSATPTDAEQGDRFYPRLLNLAVAVQAKIVLFEVADIEQAERVARIALDLGVFDGVEIWRDQPGLPSSDEAQIVGTLNIPAIGSGHGRSVVCWRGPGSAWLGKDAAMKQ